MTHLELAFESGDESLSVRSFRVEEGLNAFFTVAITARSVDPDLDLTSFVGQDAAFFLAGGVERQRRWTGVCSRMEQVRVEPAGLSTYDLTIMPRLWFLTQRRNHRIFQHQSIPSILQRLLAEWGIEPVWNLDRGQYPGLELRIQYGESDYAFLSRLVEEAGITFFFVDQRADDPEQGSRLVFEDRPQGAERRPELLPFVDAPEAAQAGRLEYLTAVRVSDQVRPGKHVVRDFDFRRPSHRLLGDASAGAGGLTAMLEQYHYLPGAALAETGQGGDTPVGDDKGVGRHADATGQRLAQRSLDSHRALKRAVHFQTNAFDLAPGVVFAVDNHPRSDLAFDKNLLVVHVLLTGAVGEAWTVSGKALFADQPHYPAHVTPKPRIVGVQSAVVVGPEGQEIHTDEYGRVRVQFHWDREGQFNEESFVWIRVSQGWAGGGYGMISLPRVGHEVLVQFMDGDPDSPLIVGRAFNATTTVPYALPDHKTVSTWRSASSPGADGFNEIKMEDKKGQELLYLQAEKDHAKLVKNDEVTLIGNDRTKLVEHDEMSSIKNDRVKVVQHDERVSVQNDRTGLVGNDEHLAVGRDRVTQIAKNETLAVGANHATQVAKNASLSVGESRSAHIGKSDQTSVGESQSVTVGQSRSATIGINDSTLVGSQYSVTIANGLGGKLSGILGKLLDGSVLGSLGSIASPLLAGPMEQVMGALKKGPFGDTPLTTFMQGPMATLQAVLPGKLRQVASMMSGPLSSVFGAGEQPTSFSMVDKKITLTTGDATIQLEGGKITLSAKEGIFLQAGQVIDLTAGMVLQAQANVLVKIQAGPTPAPPTEAPEGSGAKPDALALNDKPKPPVGDLVILGMKQVEVGSPELVVVASKKDVVVVAEQTLTMAGNEGVTVISAAGETIVKGTMVQLNPPEAKQEEQEEGEPKLDEAAEPQVDAAPENTLNDTVPEGQGAGEPKVLDPTTASDIEHTPGGVAEGVSAAGGAPDGKRMPVTGLRQISRSNLTADENRAIFGGGYRGYVKGAGSRVGLYRTIDGRVVANTMTENGTVIRREVFSGGTRDMALTEYKGAAQARFFARGGPIQDRRDGLRTTQGLDTLWKYRATFRNGSMITRIDEAPVGAKYGPNTRVPIQEGDFIVQRSDSPGFVGRIEGKTLTAVENDGTQVFKVDYNHQDYENPPDLARRWGIQKRLTQLDLPSIDNYALWTPEQTTKAIEFVSGFMQTGTPTYQPMLIALLNNKFIDEATYKELLSENDSVRAGRVVGLGFAGGVGVVTLPTTTFKLAMDPGKWLALVSTIGAMESAWLAPK